MAAIISFVVTMSRAMRNSINRSRRPATEARCSSSVSLSRLSWERLAVQSYPPNIACVGKLRRYFFIASINISATGALENSRGGISPLESISRTFVPDSVT